MSATPPPRSLRTAEPGAGHQPRRIMNLDTAGGRDLDTMRGCKEFARTAEILGSGTVAAKFEPSVPASRMAETFGSAANIIEL